MTKPKYTTDIEIKKKELIKIVEKDIDNLKKKTESLLEDVKKHNGE